MEQEREHALSEQQRQRLELIQDWEKDRMIKSAVMESKKHMSNRIMKELTGTKEQDFSVGFDIRQKVRR